MNRRILVATDARPRASGALRVAKLLAERDGSKIDVVAVHEPVEFYASGAMGTATGSTPANFEYLVAALERRVHAQLAEVGLEIGRDCSLSVLTGQVAPCTMQAAETSGAELILIGLHPYSVGERVLGGETALRIIRLARVPVLGVPEDMDTLPTQIVAALDDGEFSLRALHAVPGVAGTGATLHLAHALWGPEEEHAESSDWLKTYRTGAEQRLSDLAVEVERQYGLRADVHILAGSPANAVLDLADGTGAQLIAAGSHGLGFIGRLFLGSVSTKLVRGARCAVLIAPPAGPVKEAVATFTERDMLESLGRAGQMVEAGATRQVG